MPKIDYKYTDKHPTGLSVTDEFVEWLIDWGYVDEEQLDSVSRERLRRTLFRFWKHLPPESGSDAPHRLSEERRVVAETFAAMQGRPHEWREYLADVGVDERTAYRWMRYFCPAPLSTPYILVILDHLSTRKEPVSGSAITKLTGVTGPYEHLRFLERHGLVVGTPIDRSGFGGKGTLYAITQKGRDFLPTGFAALAGVTSNQDARRAVRLAIESYSWLRVEPKVPSVAGTDRRSTNSTPVRR